MYVREKGVFLLTAEVVNNECPITGESRVHDINKTNNPESKTKIPELIRLESAELYISAGIPSPFAQINSSVPSASKECQQNPGSVHTRNPQVEQNN